MKTFIIAEAGVNHNGDIDTALRLVDAAGECGADAVKFQSFSASKVVTGSAGKASYQARDTDSGETQLEMLRRLELSRGEQERLFEYCLKKGVKFMSTPFDEESADFLYELGMDIFKVASGEITNRQLLQHIAARKRPMIISTGMSSIEDVRNAVSWATEAGGPPLTLLHCVSSYPAPVEETNLLAIKTLGDAFDLPVGFSDHSTGVYLAPAAVALGAVVIEKHFTLSRRMKGPDHKASLEPAGLSEMIRGVRDVERAMGDGIKRASASEMELRRIVRRSLVAARDLNAGDKLTAGDLTVKRPGVGIAPELMEEVLGRRTARDIDADSVITWEDIQDA